jgi:hypothetical protein
MDQQRSTCGEASRILVDVHLGSFLPTCSFGDFQIGGSRLDGQLFSRNNVLAHHTELAVAPDANRCVTGSQEL